MPAGPRDPARRLFDAIGAQLLLHDRLGMTRPILEGREIEGMLGAGGFGLVCNARHQALARHVALKLFPLEGLDEVGVREALREARSLARLEHPNIVTVHAVGEGTLEAATSMRCAFVEMQLIEGSTLRAWAQTRDHAASILARMLEAGRALGYAHGQGVLHRDFKPENVMVDTAGRARVIDFGLALASDAADGDGLGERLTTTGFVRGTPGYMAPEASVQGPQEASDQFSFALVLQELLSGRHPLAEGAVAAHPGDGDALLERLAPVLDRATKVSPGDRFESMDALCDALEAASRPPRAPRRWPWVAAASVVGVGALGWVSSGSRPSSTPVAAFAPAQAEVRVHEPAAPEVQPVDVPPPVPEEDPPPGDRSCDDLEVWAGTWNVGARTMWTEYAYQLGWRSEFGLELEFGEACTLSVHATKVPERLDTDPRGEPLFAEAEAEAIPDPDGTWRVPLTLAFEGDTNTYGKDEVYDVVLTLREVDGVPAMRGVADKHTRDGYLLRTAIWEGRRGLAPAASAIPTDDLACAARCQLLCAGDRSRVACRRNACADHEATPGDPCGPASFDFEPPLRARSERRRINAGESPLQASLAKGSSKRLMPQCVRNGRRLSGDWGLWHTGADGVSQVSELSLAAEGCTLAGTAKGPDGETVAVTGEVTPAGTWTLDPASATIWFPATFVLVGVAEGAPALGVDASDNDSTVRAYRRAPT